MVKRDLFLGRVAPIGEDLSEEAAKKATERMRLEKNDAEPAVIDLREFSGKREPTQEEIDAEVKRIKDINNRYKPYFETLQKFNASNPIMNITERDIDMLLEGVLKEGSPAEIHKDKNSLKENLLKELDQHLSSIKGKGNKDITRAKNELQATRDYIMGL